MKTKRINIYLNEDTRKKCKELQNKYKVSLSTLADEITNRYCIFNHAKEELEKDYICKSMSMQKTSIKPKNTMYSISDKASKIYSNALYIYCSKQEPIIGLLELKEKIRNEIYNALMNKREIYWNYNDQIRNTRRMIKANPEYWERVIKEEKGEK